MSHRRLLAPRIEGVLATGLARFERVEYGRPLAQGVCLGSPGRVHALHDERLDLVEQRSVEGRGSDRQRADVQTLDLHLVGRSL